MNNYDLPPQSTCSMIAPTIPVVETSSLFHYANITAKHGYHNYHPPVEHNHYVIKSGYNLYSR